MVDTQEQENVIGEWLWNVLTESFLAEQVLLAGTKEQSEGSGNECGFEGVGQSLGPWRSKVPLTQGGGS